MKITNIKTTPLISNPKRNFIHLLVEVETDEGLTGIGETDAGLESAGIIPGQKALIEKGFSQVLVGEDPVNYRPLFDKMMNHHWYSHSGTGLSALAGVDMALVDLAGKALNIPACKLFGGCYHKKVRPYASHPIVTPKTYESAIEESLALIEEGYTAIKFSFSWFENFGENLKADMEIVRKVRDAIGYDIDI